VWYIGFTPLASDQESKGYRNFNVMAEDWFLAKDGNQYGPFSLDELQKRLSGFDLADLLVWRTGFENWKPASEVGELRLKPPPLPLVVRSADSTALAGPSDGKAREKSGPVKILDKAVVIAAYIVSFILAKFIGANFWLPMCLIFGTWFVLKKLNVAPVIVPMMAIVMGHVAWIAVGIVILTVVRGMDSDLGWATIDPVMVAALSYWVFRAKSVSSCVGVMIYEFAGLMYVLLTFGDSGGDETAMTMHILLRIVAIGVCGYTIWKLRAQSSEEAPLRSS
jgi:hypothetical protein